MSLLINGMDMPKSCINCDLRGVVWGNYKCTVSDKIIKNELNRPNDCPLTEILTPHGDLIDRDHLLQLIEGWREDVENDKENDSSFIAGKTLDDVIRLINGADAIIEA